MLAAPGSRRSALQPKEGVALINGTQAHTAVGALALRDAQRLWRVAHVAGAMSLEALKGTPVAFDERIQEARGRPARPRPRRCCATLLADSEIRESHRQNDPRVQDAYALRCMPQVHGPVRDAMRFCAGVIGREINAATDNPLLFDDGATAQRRQLPRPGRGAGARFPGDRAHEPRDDQRAPHRAPRESRLNEGLPAVPLAASPA